jgi:hypothetical protein
LGKDVGTIWALDSFVYVIGPALGGVILGLWNFNVLFLLVGLMILISNAPLFFTKEKIKGTKFEYLTIYRMIFTRRFYRSFIAFLGFGEELIVMVLWPIFIYLAIHNYFEIGGIISLATMITAVVILIIGRLADHNKKYSLLQYGVVSYFISWFLRGIVRTPLQVLSIDTLSRISKNTLFVPLDAMVYEDARRDNPMAYLLFYDVSLSIGKVLGGMAIYLVLGFTTNWMVIFSVAGFFSLLYLFYRRP